MVSTMAGGVGLGTSLTPKLKLMVEDAGPTTAGVVAGEFTCGALLLMKTVPLSALETLFVLLVANRLTVAMPSLALKGKPAPVEGMQVLSAKFWPEVLVAVPCSVKV